MGDEIGFLAALSERFQSAEDPALQPFIDAMAELDLTAETRPPKPKFQRPSLSYLEPLLRTVSDDRVRAAAHELDWDQVFEGGGIEPRLAEGMLAAQFAGSYGRYPAKELAVGLFLLAPGIHYPLHTHAAPEVYLSLAGTLELVHGLNGEPFSLSKGDYSVTPSGRVHSLTTHQDPVLLAYVWIGEILDPNWWWSQDENGAWIRTAWGRQAGGPFRAMRQEPLSETQIKLANE